MHKLVYSLVPAMMLLGKEYYEMPRKSKELYREGDNKIRKGNDSLKPVSLVALFGPLLRSQTASASVVGQCMNSALSLKEHLTRP